MQPAPSPQQITTQTAHAAASCSSSGKSVAVQDRGVHIHAWPAVFPLLTLPEELLLEVAASCSDPKDVVSLISCCKRLSFLRLEPVLTAAWIQRNLPPLQICDNPTILTKMLRAVSEEHLIQVLKLLGPPALKHAPLVGSTSSITRPGLGDLLSETATPSPPSTSDAITAAQLPPHRPALSSVSATPRIARGSTGLGSSSRGPPVLSALSCTLTGRTGSSLSGSHRSPLRHEASLPSSTPGSSSLGTGTPASSSEITPAVRGQAAAAGPAAGAASSSSGTRSSGFPGTGLGLQRSSIALVDGSSMTAVAGSVCVGEAGEVREEEGEEEGGTEDIPDCYLASPEVQSEWLCAALHLGRRKAATLLLAPGTQPILDYRDGLPLRAAAGHGMDSVVAALLERGARVDKQDNSALARAAAHGQVSTIKLLLGAGADVRAGHDRALHLAVSSGSLPAVEALLDAGANVSSTADFALRNAARLGHVAIVRALLAAGADPRAAHDDALFQAAKGGHVDVVKLLLAQGAGSHGIQDIITLAEEKRHLEIARLLRQSQREPLLMKFSFPAALSRLSMRASSATAAANAQAQGQQGQGAGVVHQQQQQQQPPQAGAGGGAAGEGAQGAAGAGAAAGGGAAQAQAAAVLSPEAAAQMQAQGAGLPGSPTAAGSKLKRLFCWLRGG